MSCLPNLDKMILKYPNWQGLGTNIRKLDMSTDTEPEAVIDRSKALFETVSKTLLVRLGEDAREIEPLTVTALRQKLLDRLKLDQADEKIIKNLIDILASSRNSEGIIGHGRDLGREAEIRAEINLTRNDFIIASLDSCLCYMIDIIESKYESEEEVEAGNYTANTEYNDYLDLDAVEVEIRGVKYKPSELLFYTDRMSYNEGLAEFTNLGDTND